jgi:transcriptional/translational regulatory protein YebC/TACO1
LTLKKAIEETGARIVSSETGYTPLTAIPVTDKEQARAVLKLVELLEDNDDVQNVYANYDIPADWIAELS